jgi:hypothetical protein
VVVPDLRAEDEHRTHAERRRTDLIGADRPRERLAREHDFALAGRRVRALAREREVAVPLLAVHGDPHAFARRLRHEARAVRADAVEPDPVLARVALRRAPRRADGLAEVEAPGRESERVRGGVEAVDVVRDAREDEALAALLEEELGVLDDLLEARARCNPVSARAPRTKRKRTLGEEVLDGLGGLLVHLVERALDLARDARERGRVPARARRVAARDLLEHLREACVLAERVAVQLAHVRAAPRISRARGEGRGSVLLDVAQEPPVRDVLDAREDEHGPAARDEREPEERGAAQDLRVVQVPVDARVVEVRGELLHEEVAEEPAEHTEDLVRLVARPDVQADEELRAFSRRAYILPCSRSPLRTCA